MKRAVCLIAAILSVGALLGALLAADAPPSWLTPPVVTTPAEPALDAPLAAAAEQAPAATRSFKQTLEQAAVAAYRSKQISRWDLARIRMALLSRPRAIAECQSCVVDQACADGLMASSGPAFADGFDWTQLLEFIKQLLPLILEIIKIFSV